jgi:hypothetical protein
LGALLESLRKRILIGFARLNKHQLNTSVFSPLTKRMTHNFGAIVTPDCIKQAVKINQLIHHAYQSGCWFLMPPDFCQLAEFV